MVMLGIVSSLVPIVALLVDLLYSDEPDSVREIPAQVYYERGRMWQNNGAKKNPAPAATGNGIQK